MAPNYAPMMPPPPQTHHLVPYTGQHMNTPTPSPYYHPTTSPAPTVTHLPRENHPKRPMNLRVEIPNDEEEDKEEKSQPPPVSALPSQFAHNLPSPSTFYPEFYQQNELPSPLNFSSTPISGGTSFHWPSSRGSMSGPGGTGGNEYRPSPLAKM